MNILEQLKAGELPEVKVSITKESIVNLAIALTIVAVIIILLSYFFRKNIA